MRLSLCVFELSNSFENTENFQDRHERPQIAIRQLLELIVQKSIVFQIYIEYVNLSFLRN